MKFKLIGEFIPLVALLKATGIAQTGGQASMMVEDGEVQVNGELMIKKRAKIRVGDSVRVEGQMIQIVE